MAAGMGGLAGYLWLLLLLPHLGGRRLVAGRLLWGGEGISRSETPLAEEEVLSQVAFVQRSLASEEGPGEFSLDWDGDEIYHVDPERWETVWRLPYFPRLVGILAKDVPEYMAMFRTNLDILMRRSNNTPVENVPPKVMLYPEKPVELGETNVLICLANEFFPPVINLTWVKNGQEVKATEETDFYPSTDHSFRKFSYLAFVPNAEDVYYCRVEHWGLGQPLTREWNANMAEPLPETEANVLCSLGLAVGVVGIIVGTVFLVKNRQMNEANFRRRPG